ncbi:unnamed protein product [Vicia faba]|uniref:B-like cyclin n=1 Tax=Vicia faba TaxID=3906 RepID=A0AAV1A2S0_VICFA|nr:unnamed protein product [Vicia faba]
MAIHHHHHHHHHHNQTVSSLLDALYCDEEKLEEEEDVSSPQSDITTNNEEHVLDFTSLSPLLSLEQNLFSQDEELSTLFYKEKTQLQTYYEDLKKNVVDFVSLSQPRREAVQWMLKVNAHYAFSPLTATLAVTYFDRFLLTFLFQKDKPWMIQLVAVTCISLAAKVEETQVPLLLDLQVQDTKYVFEAKTIQRMELLILSTLKWKMHPVTPHSFLDHIITRLGLKTNLHWEFLRRCENLLLSVLLDSRFVGCVPSVLATATMLHVIDQIEESDDNGVDYKNQLLNILKINKEKVDECYNVIVEVTNGSNYGHKRKYEQVPGSPSGVIDAVFSSDGSNDSWKVGSSSSYSTSEPVFKKTKTQGQNRNLSPLNRAIVGILATASATSP